MSIEEEFMLNYIVFASALVLLHNGFIHLFFEGCVLSLPSAISVGQRNSLSRHGGREVKTTAL